MVIWRMSTRECGSSPLTRGKRAGGDLDRPAIRLIPAHAGKTACRRPRRGRYPAHPRSRGENYPARHAGVCGAGSSPLTRGKHRPLGTDLPPGRLIPAHAGKTWTGSPQRPRKWAHPRSRGENRIQRHRATVLDGSSPLTRGKLREHPQRVPRARLIPAHAGKTETRALLRDRGRAHPRSRGGNRL